MMSCINFEKKRVDVDYTKYLGPEYAEQRKKKSVEERFKGATIVVGNH